MLNVKFQTLVLTTRQNSKTNILLSFF